MEMIQTVGRRKTAVARVHMTTGEGKVMVNGKEYTDYFPILKNQIAVILILMGFWQTYK